MITSNDAMFLMHAGRCSIVVNIPYSG